MPVNNLLIIDTETTGLDPAQGAECIEIGAILYNVPSRAILAQVSTLLRVKENGQQNVHGIELFETSEFTSDISDGAINLISSMVGESDYAVAHYADFDKQFFSVGDLQWLCTYEDFNFTPYKNSNLVNLALSHGIAVKSAHRALNDCGLIAEIFSKRDDLEALIEAAIVRARSPKVLVEALVGYGDRDKAKAFYFQPHYENGKFKNWRKLIKECDLETLTFDWRLIK
jgi:DNA polymerase-3 subunit epsilon